MGTYTTNKNLFMPTVGEQGWGTLVNGNFETIDTFLKPISLSGSTYTFTGNQTGGSISATSITNSETLTSTGKITANGGIGTTSLTTSSTITSTGKVTVNNVLQCQKLYVNGRILTTKMSNYSPTYATCNTAQTLSVTGSRPASGYTPNVTKSSTITVEGFKKSSISYPARVGAGIYVPTDANVTNVSFPTVSRTATLTITNPYNSQFARLYVNGTLVAAVDDSPTSVTYTVKSGDTVYIEVYAYASASANPTASLSIAGVSTVYYLDGI